MNKKLKPCPFCGSSNVDGTDVKKSYGNINCLDCKASVKNQDANRTVTELFNNRPSPWKKIGSIYDLPTETDLWFHNGVDAFQSWVNVCVETGENYIVDNEDATHWMEIPKPDQAT